MKIKNKIILFQGSLIILVMFAFSFVQYRVSHNELEAQTFLLNQRASERLSSILPGLIEANDRENINSMIGSELEETSIRVILLRLNDGLTLAFKDDTGEIHFRFITGVEIPSSEIWFKEDLIDYSDSKLGQIWVAPSFAPMKASLRKSLVNTILETLALLVLILGGSIVLMKLVVSDKLIQISRRTQELSHGDGDLTQTIEVSTRDEMLDLAQGFNGFIANLRTIIVNLKELSIETLKIRDQLGENATEVAASMQQIDANTKSITDQINRLDSSMESASAVLSSVNENLHRQKEKVTDEVRAVESATSAINQMVSSVESVSSTTETKTVLTEKLVKLSQDGSEKMASNSEAVNRIYNEIDAISQMLEIINSISSQTNLLAMNAAIEAAHAGEAGRGFSVVAEEIRKLAEESNSNSTSIGQILHNMVDYINEASQVSKDANESFSNILKGVKDVSSSFAEISATMKELSSGGREILEAMVILNDTSKVVNQSTQEIGSGSQQLNAVLRDVQTITQEVNSGMGEISLGIQECTLSMNNVAQLAQQMGEKTDLQDRQIGRFKV